MKSVLKLTITSPNKLRWLFWTVLLGLVFLYYGFLLTQSKNGGGGGFSAMFRRFGSNGTALNLPSTACSSILCGVASMCHLKLSGLKGSIMTVAPTHIGAF